MSGFILQVRFYMLCGSACFLFSCNRGDLPQRLAGCAESVTQIEFSQGKDTTTLTEVDGKWIVNHGRAARAACLSDWWHVVLHWQLRPFMLDEVMKPEIVNQVVREGIRNTVYTKYSVHPLLTFYICNIKYTGVVVYYDSRLFLANMPYADEVVTDVFSASPAFWKDVTVFAYLPSDLDTVAVEHLQRPEASFQLNRDGSEWQPVALGARRAAASGKNEALIKRHVTYFQQVEADAVIDRLTAPELEAARRHLQHRISVKSAKGNLTVELFGIPLAAGKGYDTDKCLLFMVENDTWAQGSWVYFDLLLRDLNDFVDKK